MRTEQTSIGSCPRWRSIRSPRRSGKCSSTRDCNRSQLHRHADNTSQHDKHRCSTSRSAGTQRGRQPSIQGMKHRARTAGPGMRFWPSRDAMTTIVFDMLPLPLSLAAIRNLSSLGTDLGVPSLGIFSRVSGFCPCRDKRRTNDVCI